MTMSRSSPRLVGGMGLAAVVGANPLLLIVTVVALGRAFHTARRTGEWKEFTDGLARGGICTGAVLLATSMVSGPRSGRAADRRLCGNCGAAGESESQRRGDR